MSYLTFLSLCSLPLLPCPMCRSRCRCLVHMPGTKTSLCLHPLLQCPMCRSRCHCSGPYSWHQKVSLFTLHPLMQCPMCRRSRCRCLVPMPGTKNSLCLHPLLQCPMCRRSTCQCLVHMPGTKQEMTSSPKCKCIRAESKLFLAYVYVASFPRVAYCPPGT